MNPLESSKWIWIAQGESPDQYADFLDRATYHGGSALMRLCCDSDYTLYINGAYVASNQYGDYRHYKIYDELDISSFLRKGENQIHILAYHCGVANQRYIPDSAGLIYEILCEGEAPVCSRAEVLSRQNPAYASGRQVLVTSQLGFSFYYDATREHEEGYQPSVEVDKPCQLYPRPIKKAEVRAAAPIKTITRMEDGRLWRIDLGGEVVGLPTLELFSETEQELTVSWGEHLEDGCVRRIIGSRDFSFVYKAKRGQNIFTDYMLRLGCRYLEVRAEQPIEVAYLGVLPQVYKTVTRPYLIESETDRRIYEACVKTLNLCMMEHYVDCPWREQALYTCDSRNQMLCGYYAFEDGNAAYARANLKLIGEDRREDGHLSICFPCGAPLVIPSFSLYYLIEMREYAEHTKDLSLAREMIPKMTEICGTILANMKNGLVQTFEGESMWNFYDWSKYSQEKLRIEKKSAPDLVINCLMIWALDALESMCRAVKADFPYSGKAEAIRQRVREVFLSPNGLFTMHVGAEEYTTLGNSLAILSGVAERTHASRICAAITGGETEECSLSMKLLEYSALLQTDTEAYRAFVLDEIRRNYTYMLEKGSGTVWETLDGASAFKNAGSLCHGWSAIPIYIYHSLGVARHTSEHEQNET